MVNLHILSKIEDVPLTIEQYTILKLLDEGFTIMQLSSVYWKAGDSILDLEGLGLIDENGINSSGKKILDIIDEAAKEENNEFKKFWNAFPHDDEWGHFPKTRITRSGERSTRKHYVQAVKKHGSQVILDGLEAYVQWCMDNSTANNNKLKFIQSPTNFLINATYLEFRRDKEDSGRGMSELL